MINNAVQPTRQSQSRRRPTSSRRRRDEIHRHLHPPAGAGDRRQPDDPGARPARRCGSLPVLQYPRTENAVVTVTTTYYGADPDVVAGFITTPLENAIAQANGIDYMTSTSQSGRQHDHRQPAAELRPRQGADRDQHQGQLGAQPAAAGVAAAGADGHRSARPSTPCISASTATCCRPTRSPTTWSAWCSRSCRRCTGVQTAEILGGQNFALRAWLDPAKLAAYGLTAADVSKALAQQRLHLRPRQHQGPDGAGQPDRLDQPALARRVPQSGASSRRTAPSSG